MLKSQEEPYKRDSETFEDFNRVSSQILQETYSLSNSNFWSTYGGNDIDVVIDFEDNR